MAKNKTKKINIFSISTTFGKDSSSSNRRTCKYITIYGFHSKLKQLVGILIKYSFRNQYEKKKQFFNQIKHVNGTRSVVRYIYLKKENKFKFNFIASLWVPRALTIDLIWKCLYVGYAYIFNKAFFFGSDDTFH